MEQKREINKKLSWVFTVISIGELAGALAVVAYGNDPDIRSYVEEIVPTYHAAKDDLKLHGETYKKLFNNLLIAVIVEALVILAMIIID